MLSEGRCGAVASSAIWAVDSTSRVSRTALATGTEGGGTPIVSWRRVRLVAAPARGRRACAQRPFGKARAHLPHCRWDRICQVCIPLGHSPKPLRSVACAGMQLGHTPQRRPLHCELAQGEFPQRDTSRPACHATLPLLLEGRDAARMGHSCRVEQSRRADFF